MNEDEWLACRDPAAMLGYLLHNASERKWRLFACAFARQLWPQLIDKHSKRAVEVAERFADGLVSKQDREKAWTEAVAAVVNAVEKQEFECAAVCMYSKNCLAKPTYQVLRLDFHSHTWERGGGDLARDIFGNPFRPAALDPALWTPAVLALARAAYDHRNFPGGTLESDRLAVLADALEESGCTDADILGHLRGLGPHWRGCWVVDTLLDKS